MKPWNYPSLRVRLTSRMVAMQAPVLIAFTSVVAIPIVELIRKEQGLDDGVIEHIAESIQRNAAGRLELALDDDMIEKSAEYPQFWFYATDIDGNSAEMGSIPEDIKDLLDDLPRINSANIADIGRSEAPNAIVRREESDAGTLWIITGGGPEIGFKVLFATFGDALFLGLLFLLTLVSFPGHSHGRNTPIAGRGPCGRRSGHDRRRPAWYSPVLGACARGTPLPGVGGQCRLAAPRRRHGAATALPMRPMNCARPSPYCRPVSNSCTMTASAAGLCWTWRARQSGQPIA